jgi:hypothetical protein
MNERRWAQSPFKPAHKENQVVFTDDAERGKQGKAATHQEEENGVSREGVTPTFCKNKNFVQIGVYIKL